MNHPIMLVLVYLLYLVLKPVRWVFLAVRRVLLFTEEAVHFVLQRLHKLLGRLHHVYLWVASLAFSLAAGYGLFQALFLPYELPTLDGLPAETQSAAVWICLLRNLGAVALALVGWYLAVQIRLAQDPPNPCPLGNESCQ